MPEGVIGAVWAFCWGLVAASGTLVGVILGLITRLRHRAIASFMSVRLHNSGLRLRMH